MKNIFLTIAATFFISANAFAVRTVECIPGQDSTIKVTITFNRDIDPKMPFSGRYDWGATLKVEKLRSTYSYVNSKIRMTPEVDYSDINLRGDAEGLHLRLYPQLNSNNNFTNYEGQLFVNDLEARVYLNFSDRDGVTGLICK